MTNPLQQYEPIIKNQDLKKIVSISIDSDKSVLMLLVQDLRLVNTLQIIILKVTYRRRRGMYSSMYDEDDLDEEILFTGEYFNPNTYSAYEQAIICLEKYQNAKSRRDELKKMTYAI